MNPVRAFLEIALVVIASTALEFSYPAAAKIVIPILVIMVGLDFLREKKGRWLFFAAIALIPFPELQSNVVGPIELQHAFILLATLIAIQEWWQTKPHRFPKPSLRFAIYYFVLVTITLIQFREIQSWHRLSVLFFLFLIALLSVHYLRSKRHFIELLYVVGATSVLTVLLGLGAFYLAALTRTYFENPYIHISTTEGVPRLAGTLLDSNFLGMHLLLILPASLAWTLSRKTLLPHAWRTWVGWGITLLLTSSLLLTYSRSAYLGILAAVLVLIVMLRPRHALIKTVLIIVASGLMATIFYLPFPFYTLYRTPTVLLPTYAKEKLLLGFDPKALVEEYRLRVLNDPSLSDDEREQLLARDVSSDSLGYRLIFWRAGLQMWRDNPLIGVGVGQFRYRFADYANIEFLRQPDTHNIYVEQLVETGLIGFAFFVWILASAVRELWKLRRTNKVAASITMASLVGVFVQSFLLGGFGALPLFLTLGTAGALVTHKWQD